MTNPFWEYSCAAYSRRGVSGLCLVLQDRLDIDVNVLLYAAWLGEQHKVLALEHLEGVDEQVAQWRFDIVRPLRALRRELKALGAPGPSYEDVQKLELCAEEQQQHMMYAYFQAHSEVAMQCAPAGGCMLGNLQLVAQFYTADGREWNDKVQRLSQYLSA